MRKKRLLISNLCCKAKVRIFYTHSDINIFHQHKHTNFYTHSYVLLLNTAYFFSGRVTRITEAVILMSKFWPHSISVLFHPFLCQRVCRCFAGSCARSSVRRTWTSGLPVRNTRPCLRPNCPLKPRSSTLSSSLLKLHRRYGESD